MIQYSGGKIAVICSALIPRIHQHKSICGFCWCFGQELSIKILRWIC